MSPILGIFASQGRVAANSYDSIATVTVGAGGSSTVSFSSIPSTYKHLQIRAIMRSTSTPGSIDNYLLTFNGDTAANYSTHRLDANGSIAYTQTYTSATAISNYTAPNSTTTANVFGAAIFDILDYANTSKTKTMRQLGGEDLNGSGTIAFDSGAWYSTTAITSITFALGSGNFAQYSQFALYGIKGA